MTLALNFLDDKARRMDDFKSISERNFNYVITYSFYLDSY